MSTRLEQLRQQAIEAAEITAVDMSETSSGPQRRILPEGYAYGRLVEYVEFGKQPQEFNGKAKAPALEFKLGFALWDTTEGQGYTNEDGTPTLLRSFEMALGNNEKSKSKIAFDRMNYKGTAKHFAQLLGEAFLIPVIIKKAKASGKERNEIDWGQILPPFDVVSKQPYPVPDADDALYRMFLWDVPTKEAWDDLHIEGTWDDGKSKNFVQEKCLSAVDFEGSALQELLGGVVPDHTAEPAPEPEPEAKQTPEVPQTPAKPSATPDIPKVPNIPQLKPQA